MKINLLKKKILKLINLFYYQNKYVLIKSLFIIFFLLYFIGNYSNVYYIKVAYYCLTFKNSGVERVMSLLIKYLSKEKIFIHYLITKKGKNNGEYYTPKNTHRIYLSEEKINLFEALKKYQIDILIYNFYNISEIKELNRLKSTKIIYYDHSSFFFWIYKKVYNFKDTIYNEYKNCNFVISLIPIENDYLFKKWGINSILLDNPVTFEFNSIVPSDLTKQVIIMIGRAYDVKKRFDLGIKAMESIIKEIPKSEMNIISASKKSYEILIHNLKLEKYVRFVGYQENIEIYLKNSSLHIFPSISEAYPMVLSETKIFGIPTIMLGLDYLALSQKGTVIIYDDNPNTIAKEAIKLLKNDTYRNLLGNEARESMKNRTNEIIAKKWVKVLLSVYQGNKYSFMKLSSQKTLSEKEAEFIISNQLTLFKKRRPIFRALTIEALKNYSII